MTISRSRPQISPGCALISKLFSLQSLLNLDHFECDKRCIDIAATVGLSKIHSCLVRAIHRYQPSGGLIHEKQSRHSHQGQKRHQARGNTPGCRALHVPCAKGLSHISLKLHETNEQSSRRTAHAATIAPTYQPELYFSLVSLGDSRSSSKMSLDRPCLKQFHGAWGTRFRRSTGALQPKDPGKHPSRNGR